MNPLQRSTKKESGMSLIELMIAMVVLMVGVLAVMLLIVVAIGFLVTIWSRRLLVYLPRRRHVTLFIAVGGRGKDGCVVSWLGDDCQRQFVGRLWLLDTVRLATDN